MAHLKISPDFYKTEVREGFPVGEMMKRNWAAQLQVLEDVRELCEKHDIKWFAYSGTALGAVRHKGFIPWDDDIDICMVGEDFIKFLYYAKDELDGRYLHLSPYDRGDWDQRTIFRIANTDHLSFESDHLDEWNNCPLAIGTDVFPFYYVPRDKKKEDFIVDLLFKVESLYYLNEYCIKHIKSGDVETAKAQEDLIAASIIGLQQDTGFTFTADRPLANQLCMLFDQICRFTVEDEADCVTRYNVLMKNRSDRRIPKELFYEKVMHPFEMIEVPMPKDYDFYLEWQYGKKYMIPSRTGAAHDYPYFSKQIRMFQAKFEIYDWVKKQGGSDFLRVDPPHKEPLSESKNDKTVVLYYTSVREMIIYDEYVINKIKDVIKYFEEHKDSLTLYWCPGAFIGNEDHPDILPVERVTPELKEKYEKLVEEFKSSGIGICDETGELNKAIDACDIYYGDEGLLQDFFSKTGKPVYIQDYHILWDRESATPEDALIKVTFPPKGSGLFGEDIQPIFGDASYLSSGKGYAMATNMNGLFEVDKNNGTCKYLHFIKGEKPNGKELYTKAVPFGEKIVFIPGSANQLVIYNPENNTYKEINVYIDILNPWCDQAKYADCIEYEGKLFLFGERYNYVLKVDPESGETTPFDDGQSDIVWMRHAAFREGGLVRIVSALSTDILTFNLRKEQIFVQKSYSKNKVNPILAKLVEEKDKHSLKGIDLKPEGDFDRYRNGSFESFDVGKGMVIKEQDDWISFEEVVKYTEWKKQSD